jgi:hypothetical protein
MINPFCFIGVHNWQYRKEKHKVLNHPMGREHIRVIVRECKQCGKRQFNAKFSELLFFSKWKN